MADLQNAQIRVVQDHTFDVTGVLDDILGFVFTFAVGVFPTPVLGLSVPALVFIGVEAGSLITNGSLGPGAHIAEGWLWLAGPEGSFYAILADWLASIGENHRPPTPQEYDWLKRQVVVDAAGHPQLVDVFGDNTLPPPEDIILTDTIGAGNRPFVFPTWNGKMTVNLGPDGFADPINWDRDGAALPPDDRPAGHTFIHEMTHVWQIHHRSFPTSYVVDASLSQIGATIGGGDPYDYGPPGGAFSSFGIEAQAELFADWWAGYNRHDHSLHGQLKASPGHPYYQYAAGNIQGNVTD